MPISLLNDDINSKKYYKIGDEIDLVYITRYLYKIILDNDYEYIDFMCFGFSKVIIEKACFTKIDFNLNELSFLNYFAPFFQEKIKINFIADIKI